MPAALVLLLFVRDFEELKPPAAPEPLLLEGPGASTGPKLEEGHSQSRVRADHDVGMKLFRPGLLLRRRCLRTAGGKREGGRILL